MNIKHLLISVAGRRFGPTLAALAAAAGMAVVSPAAQAQAGTLVNPSNCSSFTGFSWSGGQLTLTCAATTIPACTNTNVGTFTWVSLAATVAAGNSVTGQLQRVGGCSGAYTILIGNNAAASNGSVSATSVSFADGETGPKNVTVTTTAQSPVGAQIAVWVNGATTTPWPNMAGTFVATVTAAPPAQQTGGGSSCGATYCFSMVNNDQIVMGTGEAASKATGLKPGETIAVAFTYTGPTNGSISISPVSNPYYTQERPSDLEIAIKSSPATFGTQGDACDQRVPAAWFIGGGSPFLNAGTTEACQLVLGQSYYLNIRHMKSDWSNTPSCTNTQYGCTLRVQPTGLN